MATDSWHPTHIVFAHSVVALPSLRPGLRLQITIAVGILLVLAFFPLYVAVARLSVAALIGVRESDARALGRAVVSHVHSVRSQASSASPSPLPSALLDAQLGPDGVLSVGIYDPQGRLVQSAGTPPPPPTLDPALEMTQHTESKSALLVSLPSGQGPVAALVAIHTKSTQAAPLTRLVALYTLLVALALLIFLYLALTRLLVRPISDLARAAERVTEGAASLDVPQQGAGELVDLGLHMARMTETLLDNQRRLAEKIEEKERLMAELKAAQAHLVRTEKLASVGRLSAGLSHELGNPIAALLGLVELLELGGLSEEEEKELLRRIKGEGERMHQIVRNLLDFARPSMRSAGRVQGEEKQSCRLQDAVEDVLALIRPQKAAKDVQLETEIGVDVPWVGMAHGQMVQVLLNLLLNALDEVPKGEGHIWVGARLLDEGKRVLVMVEDNGAGIAAEVRETLFEPFVTTKEVGRGTGLGLSVCRGLVEAAGGKMYVDTESKLGGARFCVELRVLSE